MDPVGHVPDRHLGLLEPGPQAAEHVAGHLAVEAADAVGPLGQAQAHDGHVEHRVVAVGLGPELDDLVDPEAGLDPVLAEVALDERPWEPVDPGRHRGVGGEDGPGPDRLDGGGRVQALLLDQAADALQAEEPGVALVGVEHLGLDPEGVQGPDPADAEQDLLAQAVLAPAAVQPVGDRPLGRAVLVDVGVEQQQRRPPHLGPPDLGVEHPVGQAHRDQQRLAVAVPDQLEGELVGVEGRVGLLLAAVGGQRLAEVARAVEQADPDHRHAEVAGRLEVVAGEHAEAARVLGKDLADAELGGEVGDPGGGVGQGLVPAGLVEVALQVLEQGLLTGQEIGVGGRLLEHVGVGLVQHPQRVVPGGLPAGGVDGAEQLLGGGVPAPAEVVGEDAQWSEGVRHGGQHRESV